MSLMAGCGSDTKAETSKEETSSSEVTEEPEKPETEDAAEEKDEQSVETPAADQIIQEVLACGEKGDKIDTVAYIPMATSNEFFLAMTEAIMAQLTEEGFECEYTSPEFDPAMQLEIFENYVTQDFDCIVVFPINADSLNDAVKEARAQGIKVITQVNQTEECDGWVGSSGTDMGIGTCQIAAQWVNERFVDEEDGSVKAAVVTTRTDANTSAISDELEKIAEYTGKVTVEKVVETTDTSIEAGQSLAENLYMTNPDINVVIVEEPDVAIGMNSYYAGVDSPLADRSAFGIFCNNGSHSTYDLIEQSADDSQLLRGISSVAPLKYGVQMLTNVVLRLSNGEESDANFEADPVYLINKDNIAQFKSI